MKKTIYAVVSIGVTVFAAGSLTWWLLTAGPIGRAEAPEFYVRRTPLGDGATLQITYRATDHVPVRGCSCRGSSLLPLDPNDYTLSGDLSESGKQHGKWTLLSCDGNGAVLRQRVWYWYGQECSEGDFHKWAGPAGKDEP